MLALPAVILIGCGRPEGTAIDGTADQAAGGEGEESVDPPDEPVLDAPRGLTTASLLDASYRPLHQSDSEQAAGESALLLDDGSLPGVGAINDVAPESRFIAG